MVFMFLFLLLLLLLLLLFSKEIQSCEYAILSFPYVRPCESFPIVKTDWIKAVEKELGSRNWGAGEFDIDWTHPKMKEEKVIYQHSKTFQEIFPHLKGMTTIFPLCFFRLKKKSEKWIQADE